MKKVIKRDGQIEEFQKEKIKKVVQAAGLNEKEAKKLAEKISTWIEKHEKDSLSSLEIRDKVLEDLRKRDKYAAGLFEWYQKVKTKNHNSKK